MPSVLLTESIAVELGVSEPWPDDAQLYQPLEAEQILLPDRAVCLSVQAFLKMCSLNFKVEMRANSEEMSPSGKVPFMKCGKFVIAEMDPIVAFVKHKGILLSNHLDSSQGADMRAYMSLINAVLHNAELYITWNHKETYNEITKMRHGSVYPWPLRQFLRWKKLYVVRSQLACLDWLKKSTDEVYTEVDMCCHALSERLGSQNYFFGDRPTELDALVFGHLFTLLQTPLPDNSLSRIVERYDNLVKLCAKIEQTYFQHSLFDFESEER